MCGAIFLDGAFEKQIRTMISAEDYEDLGTRSKRKMMNDWEYGIKRVFKVDAPENQRWYVDIPGYLGIHVPDSVASSEVSRGLRSPRPLSTCLSSESLNRTDPGTLVLKTYVSQRVRGVLNLTRTVAT